MSCPKGRIIAPRKGPSRGRGRLSGRGARGYNEHCVRPFRGELTVAFDASGVCGAALSRGLRRPRLRSFRRVPLVPGALVPHPLDVNLRRPEDVENALRRALDGMDAARSRVCLVLPDGVARIGLVEVPPGVAPEEYARFRWTQALPYPAAEAIVDVLPLGAGRAVAAAVRRRVALEYEAAAERAGLSPGRVDLAPLAALSALLRDPPAGPASVDVILGDAAYCLAASHDGALRVLRNRRRDADAGEADRLGREVDRTADFAGNGAGPLPVRVVGPGARGLIGELLRAGRAAGPGWEMDGGGLPVEAAELPWLGAALA